VGPRVDSFILSVADENNESVCVGRAGLECELNYARGYQVNERGVGWLRRGEPEPGWKTKNSKPDI
jgi:hypothetical protein